MIDETSSTNASLRHSLHGHNFHLVSEKEVVAVLEKFWSSGTKTTANSDYEKLGTCQNKSPTF